MTLNTAYTTEVRGFLEDQFHGMVLQATVQRARIYAPDAPEGDREAFRQSLRKELDLLTPGYQRAISGAEHVRNIEQLSKTISRRHGLALRDGRFRIGPAQKALNLMLKCHWSAGWIPEPPHCPLDSIIIGKLSGDVKLNWTDLDSVAEYQRLIEAAREAAGALSLAVWELATYQESSPAAQRGNST
jgi:hypothetical protein